MDECSITPACLGLLSMHSLFQEMVLAVITNDEEAESDIGEESICVRLGYKSIFISYRDIQRVLSENYRVMALMRMEPRVPGCNKQSTSDKYIKRTL